MKISVFSLPEIALGKQNVKDCRLDEVYKITNSKKKTYAQVELVGENSILDADAVLVNKSSVADLILKDLELLETRLSRTEDDAEKALLEKLKKILEEEKTIFNSGLNAEEKEKISMYGLWTNRPLVAAEEKDLEDLNNLLARALTDSGYITFFTTGEKETRAWLIKAGTNAWEAAGAVHSDMQKGFIRAEIISLNDFLAAGGENQAKQQGKLRLEQKDYVMQYGDLANFRFNK